MTTLSPTTVTVRCLRDMHRYVYNGSLALGVMLTSVGAGLVYVPAGLITGGALLLALTIFGARLAAGGRAG